MRKDNKTKEIIKKHYGRVVEDGGCYSYGCDGLITVYFDLLVWKCYIKI